MSGTFPNDSDGMTLRAMAAEGLDMSRPVNFEFFIHVENGEDADTVLARLQVAEVGDAAEAVYDEGEPREGEEMTAEHQGYGPGWTVYVLKKMVPAYGDVVGFQETLAAVCQEAGRPDGWQVATTEEIRKQAASPPAEAAD